MSLTFDKDKLHLALKLHYTNIKSLPGQQSASSGPFY